ncbi:MAG: YceK/YidQ family lipoprotein [Desulfobacteraceae bacterium]|nr:YceK/YidQ family lipoprotein [Desulfobacteraceae bacterium]
MNRTILLIIILIMTQGCGTIRTVNPAGGHVEISYAGYKSYCKKIPRIYSGVFYDACMLYGEPNYEASESSAEGAFTMLLVDGMLSLSLDTVALPYTVTRQIIDGSISVNRIPGTQ